MTGGVLPAAVRLTPAFDTERLATDLKKVARHTWQRQQVSGYHGVPGERTELDWRVLPLRSIGGDPARTDPGGPGPADFAPTPWLTCLPYLTQVLDSLPGPVCAARLMALGPGTASHTHSDPKYAVTRGFVRLHLPIVTNPAAVLTLDGVERRWQPGELWCGQFARPHAVRNDGATSRIHLVTDMLISTGLAEMFPDDLRPVLHAQALFTGPDRDGATPADVTVDLPATFTDFAHDHPAAAPAAAAPARITVAGSRGLLTTADGRKFTLAHLGGGEFRFTGWSGQRTLHLGEATLTLRTRTGTADPHELSLPYLRKEIPC
ncbi:aspartyl/asparaginyl beta-hydroxylase domain-containing protein [Actinomadura viridis]|uniref:aspartyl/asparaginyl beta-hydroxylase domain-containing protein n=1 Tax=Actinomadura viridis TaxID=58110 RepID=UPI0036AB318B